jgi:hypothetical protein
MISPILRLNTDELLSALDAIDPVDVLTEELVGKAGDGSEPPVPDGRLTPWRGGGPDAPATELLLLEDLHIGRSCAGSARRRWSRWPGGSSSRRAW